ncbi:MAG: HpsJ family protein [Prochlorothrix sp.]|nr:HpsJ family protein [Prochlorothrix sp.]
MKSGSQRQLASITPLSLILVGSIMVLSVLLDYAAFLLWPQFLERQWQLQVISTAVDRGLVPLVGIALLLVGYWTAEQVPTPFTQGITRLPLRLFAFVLASLMGLMFLLFVPLHLRNSFIDRAETLVSIQQQAQELSAQAQQTLNAQVEQERARITALLQNEAQLNQAISSGQISIDQATLLQQFRDQPDSLEEYLSQQVEQEQERATTALQEQQSNAERQAQEQLIRSGVRTALTSLLLAIGYALVGWTGLKESR